jgi:uncharacterized PurR-regulated membrane protein YhhQ (DUF165 family)
MPARPAFGTLAFLSFLACVPLANWMIGSVGTMCVPNGPCLIPVAPGVMAPSGVMMIGVALILRDIVQRLMGGAWALAAILFGACLSLLVAPPSLVFASGLAFLISELADFAVYTPLQRRGLLLAVVASSSVGLVVDSVVFLYVAFGSIDYLAGQVIGKTWALVFAYPLVWLTRRVSVVRS